MGAEPLGEQDSLRCCLPPPHQLAKWCKCQCIQQAGNAGAQVVCRQAWCLTEKRCGKRIAPVHVTVQLALHHHGARRMLSLLSSTERAAERLHWRALTETDRSRPPEMACLISCEDCAISLALM